MIDGLLHGFAVLLTFQNLSLCLLGAVLGTLVGVLLGLGLRQPSHCCCPSA
ncbi:hypothetical protein MHZ93_14835 [Roseomonas sp. ACRSG]|nr:hypothetical protein [Roseomonas sp. ACRSG]